MNCIFYLKINYKHDNNNDLINKKNCKILVILKTMNFENISIL